MDSLPLAGFRVVVFTGFVVALGVLVLAGLLSHVGNRRARIERHHRLLAQYCRSLDVPRWRITRWDEFVSIARNGDTTSSIRIHATAESDSLSFFRILLGPSHVRPAHVSVAAFEFGSSVVQWEDTHHRLSDDQLEVLVHCLSDAPRCGDEIRFLLHVTWPGKAKPLLRHGASDDFLTRFSTPGAHLTYRVALPPGTQARYEAIGLSPDGCSLTSFVAPRDHPVVELVAEDVPAHKRVGMRLAKA